MVLPVNTESSIDALYKFTASEANQAQTRATNVNTLQKQAELNDYLSDTQKKLREAKAQAEISAANAAKLQSDVINSHPDLVAQTQLSGMQTQLYTDMAKRGAAYNSAVSSAFGTDIKDADDYEAKVKAIIASGNTEILKDMPSVAQVKSDPETYLPKVRLMVAGAWENDAKFQQERSMIDQKMDREDTQLGYRLGIEERIADKRIAADNAQLGARIASSEKEGALDRANRLEAIRLSMQGRKDLAEMNNAAKLQQIKNRASGGKAPTLRQAEGSETDIMMNVMGYVNDIADDYNLNKVQKNKLVTQAVSLGINQWNKLNNMYHRGEIATPPDIPSVIARQIIDQGLQSNEVQNGNFFKSGKYTPSEAASATPKSDYPLRGTPKPQQSSSVQEDILRGIGAGPGLDAASERAQIREEFNSPKDQSTSSARFSESGLTLGRSKDEEVKKLLTPNQFKLYMEGSPEERKAVRKHFGLE